MKATDQIISTTKPLPKGASTHESFVRMGLVDSMAAQRGVVMDDLIWLSAAQILPTGLVGSGVLENDVMLMQGKTCACKSDA